MERTSHSSTSVKGEAALSSTEKRIYIFEKAPVRRAVLQQMLPTVAGQMVALLYNLADTFFVGLLNAPIQTAAFGFMPYSIGQSLKILSSSLSMVPALANSSVSA